MIEASEFSFLMGMVLDKLGAAAADGIGKNCVLHYLHVDPATALPVLPNARDVTSIGHWGTGNLEAPLTSQADLDAVKPFINAGEIEVRLRFICDSLCPASCKNLK